MVQRLCGRDPGPALADRYHQLELVVQVAGHRGIGDGAAILDDAVGGLLEEHRRVARLVAAHLADMVDVVAADTIDPAYREALAGADDRQRDRMRDRDHETVI